MSDIPRRGPGPLAGVRVLDLTRVLSGPHCTRMLCDLGAEVVKVEPPEGDMTRYSYPRRNSISTYFTQQNVGKRNISMDLRSPRAVEIALQLAERADVVVENFRPGVMDRMGLSYETLAARNPRLVVASISGYGQTGPWRERRAYAAVVGAEAGLTLMQAEAHGGAARNDPLSHGDVYTSLELLAGILAALYQRERTGRGQWVEVSMAESLLAVNDHAHWELRADASDVGADELPSFRPGDLYVLPTSEGRDVVVAGHAADKAAIVAFCAVTGRKDLLDDPRFATVSARRAHLGELHAEIAAWTRLHTAAEIEDAFAEHAIAVGVLRGVREIGDTEWARARGAIVDVPDRGDGTVRVTNSPWHFSDADSGVRGQPAYRGEDNRAVLTEMLGLSDADVDSLETDGVLSARGPSKR
jgi:CoA:oxalate CoA-transferase